MFMLGAFVLHFNLSEFCCSFDSLLKLILFQWLIIVYNTNIYVCGEPGQASMHTTYNLSWPAQKKNTGLDYVQSYIKIVHKLTEES